MEVPPASPIDPKMTIEARPKVYSFAIAIAKESNDHEGVPQFNSRIIGVCTRAFENPELVHSTMIHPGFPTTSAAEITPLLAWDHLDKDNDSFLLAFSKHLETIATRDGASEVILLAFDGYATIYPLLIEEIVRSGIQVTNFRLKLADSHILMSNFGSHAPSPLQLKDQKPKTGRLTLQEVELSLTSKPIPSGDPGDALELDTLRLYKTMVAWTASSLQVCYGQPISNPTLSFGPIQCGAVSVCLPMRRMVLEASDGNTLKWSLQVLANSLSEFSFDAGELNPSWSSEFKQANLYAFLSSLGSFRADSSVVTPAWEPYDGSQGSDNKEEIKASKDPLPLIPLLPTPSQILNTQVTVQLVPNLIVGLNDPEDLQTITTQGLGTVSALVKEFMSDTCDMIAANLAFLPISTPSKIAIHKFLCELLPNKTK